MGEHDGDITPGTNSYYGDELTAEFDAVKIIEAAKISTADMESTCIKPGCSGHIVLEAFQMHVSGSGVYCQKHLEKHHGKPLADILATKRKTNAVVHYCARCGKRGHWVSGAGEALCSRHENDY
jgi:hypothetical protein